MTTADELAGVIASPATSAADLVTAQALLASLTAAQATATKLATAYAAATAAFTAAQATYVAACAASATSVSRGSREIFELLSPGTLPDEILVSANGTLMNSSGGLQPSSLTAVVAAAATLVAGASASPASTTAQTVLAWIQSNLGAFQSLRSPTAPSNTALAAAQAAALAADISGRTFLGYWRRPPILLSLTPSSVAHGSGDTVIAVAGSDFDLTSVVNVNGAPSATSIATHALLRFTITAAQLAMATSIQINVVTPTPGGGTSTNLAFQVT